MLQQTRDLGAGLRKNENMKLSTLGVRNKTKGPNLVNLTITGLHVDPSLPTRRHGARACGGREDQCRVRGEEPVTQQASAGKAGADILF